MRRVSIDRLNKCNTCNGSSSNGSGTHLNTDLIVLNNNCTSACIANWYHVIIPLNHISCAIFNFSTWWLSLLSLSSSLISSSSTRLFFWFYFNLPHIHLKSPCIVEFTVPFISNFGNIIGHTPIRSLSFTKGWIYLYHALILLTIRIDIYNISSNTKQIIIWTSSIIWITRNTSNIRSYIFSLIFTFYNGYRFFNLFKFRPCIISYVPFSTKL